jgi:hypothetical protein
MCGNTVKIILPDLFPELSAKKLEKYKELTTKPISSFCKLCALKNRRNND